MVGVLKHTNTRLTLQNSVTPPEFTPVAFSTSQSVRPPLRVRQAAATTHCGPRHGRLTGAAVVTSCVRGWVRRVGDVGSARDIAPGRGTPQWLHPGRTQLHPRLTPTIAALLLVAATSQRTMLPRPSHSSTASPGCRRSTRTACLASSGSSSMLEPTEGGSCGA
jgi:hypothetical protein